MRLTRVLAIAAVAALVAAGCADAKDDEAATTTAAESATTDDTTAPTTATPATEPADTEPEEAASAVPATGEPLVFGAVSSLTGPITIPGPGEAVRVYFERYNAAGGLDGRPLELIEEDASIDPGLAAAAAQKLVNADDVIGILGSSSFFDCPVNEALYASNGVPVLAAGLDGACFTSPVIFTYTPSIPDLMLDAVQFLVDEQGASTIGVVALNLPGTQEAVDHIRSFVESLGATNPVSELVPFGATAPDVEAVMLRMADAGVDAVVTTVDENTLDLLLGAAGTQGMGIADGVDWVGATGVYNPDFIELWGDKAEGLYINLNTVPLQADDPEAAEVVEALEGNVSRLDGFTLFGWQAAAILVQALERIDGEPTRAALLDALAEMDDVDVPLFPLPVDFTAPASPETPRASPAGGQLVQIRDGRFVVASDWITVEGP